MRIVNKYSLEQRVDFLEGKVRLLEFKNNILTDKDDKEKLIQIKDKLIEEKTYWEKSDAILRNSKIQDIEDKIEYIQKFL